jgi:hypothetical protein
MGNLSLGKSLKDGLSQLIPKVTLMHVFICEIFINRYTKLQDGSLNPTK